MKKVLIGLTVVSSVFLVACSNQEQSKEETNVSNPKITKKETRFHDYEHGKKYGIYAANFDKEHGYGLVSKRHIGTSWEKEYTKGYEDGYNSIK